MRTSATEKELQKNTFSPSAPEVLDVSVISVTSGNYMPKTVDNCDRSAIRERSCCCPRNIAMWHQVASYVLL